jgi:lysophospholipase L1-like esterase
VVLYEGDNDIASGKSAERVRSDYMEVTERLSEDFPDVKLVFVSIKPSSSRWEVWPEMEDANRLIREEISRNPNHYYADLATPLLGDDGRPDDSLFLDDLLHLNQQGYEKWTETIRPLLEELMEE